MSSDIGFIEKAVFLLIARLTPQEVARYVYIYLKNNPQHAKKIYEFAKVIQMVIENEFRDQIQ